MKKILSLVIVFICLLSGCSCNEDEVVRTSILSSYVEAYYSKSSDTSIKVAPFGTDYMTLVGYNERRALVKNITAQTGERTLYIRIAKPDNEVLSKNASDTFSYENRNLAYSIKKYIEYTGEEQTVTVYWDVEEYLPAGTYNVYIFADGTMIGQQSFSMK